MAKMIGYVKFGRVNVFMSRIVAEVNILSRFGVTYSPKLCIPEDVVVILVVRSESSLVYRE